MEALMLDPATKQPLPIVENGVTGPGELVVFGASVMSNKTGYFNRPVETAAAFIEIGGRSWYQMGDLVIREADGCMRTADRSIDTFTHNGQHVVPTEIESQLYKLHGVVDAVAVPIPVPGSKGEENQMPCAAVVPKNKAVLTDKALQQALTKECPVMGAVAASSSSNGRAPSPSPSPSKVGRHGSKRRGGRKTPPKAVEAPLGHPRVSSMTTTVHVDAELLPYFLDEDDACDWHMAVRDACPAARTEYAAAKREADEAFVAASNTEFAHRGIGGLRVAVPTMNNEDPDILLQRIVLPLMETRRCETVPAARFDMVRIAVGGRSVE
ncbi:hypothetical protein AMAG_18083 [Allomyces macrogynus ATCC 38327]|uniref:Uncharacterized protein n=1 Tax=Allomyces macrogynus (strain ATCC 38327) TaxID=578462 RepID=A0A0L0S9G0_ALLM3|nr:hypothetical protein AMAG_18083 [Allomyces macrogynus ATCC 38327]|eukprot:KNE59029.1 hypothetical protein AMAG_18083 [Allomyces macrogynus ATCC 38327]